MNGVYSPDDLDAWTRTVATEAGDPQGQLAVANVVANRLAAGGYGSSPGAVVTAPGQFEPWQNGRAQNLDPRSAAYQQAAQIVGAVANGDAQDTTNGSTHFYSPAGQARLGRNAPAWAAGRPLAYAGGNAFYAPQGAVVRKQQGPDAGSGIDVDGLAKMWGGSASAGQGAPSAASAATTAAPDPGNAASGAISGPAGDVDVDGLARMWGGGAAAPQSAAPGAQPGDATPAGVRPLTVQPKAVSVGSYGSLGAVDPAAIAADQGPRNALLAAAQGLPPGQQNALAPYMAGDAGMAAGRGAISGIPIAGPYLASGLDHAIAAERAIHENVPYSQALQEVQQFGADTAAAHPWASTAGAVGSNLAAFGGLGATEAGATALGLKGGNMLLRAALGGGANGAIGAADAAVRSGGDSDAIRTGAALGLTSGSLGPAVGGVAGVAGTALGKYVNSFRPQSAADNALFNAVRNSGGDLPTMAQRLADNPSLSLMDVNPGARDLAQGLAAQPGAARDTLLQAYGQRAAGAKDAVTGAYDAALGPTPDVLATLQGIKATAASNAKQGFGAALANAKPVDTSAAIKALDDQISPGVNGVVSPGSNIPLSPVQQRLQQIRGLLTTPDGSEVLTDANRLHQIQSDLGVEGRTLQASSSGSDRLMGNAVMNARGNIVDAIDNATGGQFKPAQAQYASDLSVQDAFNKGMSIFQNRGGVNGLEDRPEFWRQTVAQASPAEQQALVLGARTAADNAMQGVRNAALKGETIPQIGANLDKLRAVLGDDQANTLAQTMADEQAKASTNAALFQGSQTQPRQANRLAVGVRDLAPMSMEIGLPSFAAMTGNPLTAAGLAGAAVARRGLQVAGRAADVARNNLLASNVSATGSEAGQVVNRLLATAGQQGAPTAAATTGNALGAAFQSAPVTFDRLQGQPVTSLQIRNRLLGAAYGR